MKRRAILDALLSQFAWYRNQTGAEWEMIEQPDYGGWSSALVFWERKKAHDEALQYRCLAWRRSV